MKSTVLPGEVYFLTLFDWLELFCNLSAVMAAVEQKSSVAANVAVIEAVRGALASKVRT